jgi:pimeloyl-ACP methyl ester carboxylesterase
VFLHYWGGSHRTFAPVIARLSSGTTVLSYDNRGSGAARELPGPYGIEQLADDVLDVASQLVTGPYILAGHSMGGQAAQLVASRRPKAWQDWSALRPPRRSPSWTHRRQRPYRTPTTAARRWRMHSNTR